MGNRFLVSVFLQNVYFQEQITDVKCQMVVYVCESSTTGFLYSNYVQTILKSSLKVHSFYVQCHDSFIVESGTKSISQTMICSEQYECIGVVLEGTCLVHWQCQGTSDIYSHCILS